MFLRVIHFRRFYSVIRQDVSLENDIKVYLQNPSIPFANSLVTRSWKSGNIDFAFNVFDLAMTFHNMKPQSTNSKKFIDEGLIRAIVNGCKKCGQPEKAVGLWDKMLSLGITPSESTLGSFSSVAYELNQTDLARKIFNEMKRSNGALSATTCIHLLNIFARTRDLYHAKELLRHVEKTKLLENNKTYALLFNACAEAREIGIGKVLHARFRRSGVVPDEILYATLIKMYSFCEKLDEAVAILDEMDKANLSPTDASYLLLFEGCSIHKDVTIGKALHERYLQRGSIPGVHLATSIIKMYAKCGELDEAYNTLNSMETHQIYPDYVTYLTLFAACAELPNMELGRILHDKFIKSGLNPEKNLTNSLISMYSKFGDLDTAINIFDAAKERDLVTWCAIINGLAQNGRISDALKVFEALLKESNLTPDEKCITTVLIACCYSGFVDKANEIYGQMYTKWKIRPTMIHHHCMVEILGRAGRLDDAEQFITTMEKTNWMTWMSLLGVCRLHNDVDRAERALKKMNEIVTDPSKKVGLTVLMSNIYGNAQGHFVRKMNDEKISKFPETKISIGGQLHNFITNDWSHPSAPEIRSRLDQLWTCIKQAGYIPATEWVLEDISKEEKENILCFHGEKMAIAFGLINTPSGTPIYLYKNSRVCGDCHAATAFISKLEDRKIIVRDARGFHHFENGKCSCGNLW